MGVPEGSSTGYPAHVDLETTFNFVRVAGEYAAFRAISRPARENRETGRSSYVFLRPRKEHIREFLPGTEEILVVPLWISCRRDEDILQVARYMLESIVMYKPDVLEKLMVTLGALLQDQLTRRENVQSGPKLQRLDKVLDMSKANAMSNTIAFSEGVDLESINKGKYVNDVCLLRAICLMYYF